MFSHEISIEKVVSVTFKESTIVLQLWDQPTLQDLKRGLYSNYYLGYAKLAHPQ
jgi:hypothetical protein